ncbi:hypothetical protein MESS4_570003 [Mesorhizobium sp. STM 4661]|nr:hypothetical protein MESS4_570003 [Mesorhizobium sp. STM 4661]
MASVRFMTKRRLGTIQSSRPGYGALMPQLPPYGKSPAGFQTLDAENQAFSGIGHFEEWHGQQGSNLRPAVLETAALPTELCPYRARIGAGAS